MIQIPKRGRPNAENSRAADAALDILAIEDEQEHDELHPAERLVEPLTHLVYAMVSEDDRYKRESYGEKAIFFVHALHDHLVAADSDNHDATACAYCFLAKEPFLRPEALLAAELRMATRARN